MARRQWKGAGALLPNVILMDVGMPVMDGIHAAKEINPETSGNQGHNAHTA